MAEPICYQVGADEPAPSQSEQAWAELDRLVLLLHKHQVLRLACDSTAALAEIADLLTRELDTTSGTQALENLYLLMQTLARIPPPLLARAADAVSQASRQMAETTTDDGRYPPGISGTYHMLRDEQLWQALGPALEGLKTFAEQLHTRE